MKSKEMKSKVMKRYSNSIEPKDGRDRWLMAVMSICFDKYGIDNSDVERFITLWRKK